MSGPERFSNNDWMKASQGINYPLKLERSGLIIHLDPSQGDEWDVDFVTVQLFTDWGVGMENEPIRLGNLLQHHKKYRFSKFRQLVPSNSWFM